MHLPSISIFWFRSVVVSRSSPLLGVVYTLSICTLGRMFSSGVVEDVDGLREQNMFVRRHGRCLGWNPKLLGRRIMNVVP